MKSGRGAGDIVIDAPVARHADVVPAVEDRSYVVFIGGALVAALAGGFLLGIAVSLALSGTTFIDRGPWLVQAHGAAQLQGWAGLFVAGMGVRLLPRFAGRQPARTRANLTLFTLLFSGVTSRTVAQVMAGDGVSPGLFLAGELLWAAGAVMFSAVIGTTLLRGRGGRDPWRVFALAGAAWWLAWAAVSINVGFEGAANDAYVPGRLDAAVAWSAMLGAIGCFIWAVQSRSVPIFFGRKLPTLRKVGAPFVLLNAGTALVLAAGWLDAGAGADRLAGAGFALAGLGVAWLAPVAGSCWGRPTRLRPRARFAARFVQFGNGFAVLSGALLVWAGGHTLIAGEYTDPGLRDAARHAFGVGLITLVIAGMAQLIAPFFALQRVESRGTRLVEQAMLWSLVGAAALRVATGLLTGHTGMVGRMHISACAGVLGWTGVALFLVMVVLALRSEPRTRAALATIAHQTRK